MNRFVATVTLVALCVIGLGISNTLFAGDDNFEKSHKFGRGGSEHDRVRQGLKIAPVPLKIDRKNLFLVGLGSYIVNAQGACNDCHTNPSFAEGGDPFQGQPEQINTANYLAGGTPFGPGIVSRNITPDPETGLPAGLTWDQFKNVMRTGVDPDQAHPDISPLLQVMPWPVYGKMSDLDLRAIYEYLSAIPHAESAGGATAAARQK